MVNEVPHLEPGLVGPMEERDEAERSDRQANSFDISKFKLFEIRESRKKEKRCCLLLLEMLSG